jgi:hypothetical protein
VRFLLILLIAWSLGTCRSEAPEVPRTFEWVTWSGPFCSSIASFTIVPEATD